METVSLTVLKDMRATEKMTLRAMKRLWYTTTLNVRVNSMSQKPVNERLVNRMMVMCCGVKSK